MTVLAFPGTNWRDIAGCARDFADRADAGEFGEITRAMLVLDTDTGFHTLSWGEAACPIYVVGMLQCAQFTAFADGVSDD